MKNENQAKFILALTIKNLFKDAVPEYVFCPGRKFRADFFLPSINTLVEYEGVYAGTESGRYSGKSRHTTVGGYSKDCEKYNLAQILGFKVLRYTASNYASAYSDLKTLLKQREKN